MQPIYNHYNKNGEYTGSTVKCPGWMSPNFIATIGSPILTMLTFIIFPLITAWVLIGTWAYKRRMKRLGRKIPKEKVSWYWLSWTIVMNLMWVVWIITL